MQVKLRAEASYQVIEFSKHFFLRPDGLISIEDAQSYYDITMLNILISFQQKKSLPRLIQQENVCAI